MIIVDKALEERANSGNPIRVAIVGAGYSGKLIAYQMLTAFPGMRVVAISNRTLDRAREAYARAGAREVRVVNSSSELTQAIETNQFSIADDYSVVCEAGNIDVVIEATGTVEFGARVASSAIEHGKHVVLMNVELDATIGPILKAKADSAGLVYTNTDGDEPGVAMNMYRFVRSIGLRPVVAGNLKGLYDPYRNPETQKEFAERHGQKPSTMTHFADGTKLSMELNVLANATGFTVGRRGMHGPALGHVNDSVDFFQDKLANKGIVDFLVDADPGNGAFVIGYSEDPIRKEHLRYLKMGNGPLYVFYTPFHLPQLQLPHTVARAVLFGDATVTPAGKPSCDTIAVAKREVNTGDVLDGIGGFTCYGLLEKYATSRAQNLLPMGLSDGCTLIRNVRKDQAIKYDDVRLPANRFCDMLRDEQDDCFH